MTAYFSVLLRASVESREVTCRISRPWAGLLLSLVGWSNTRLPRHSEPAGTRWAQGQLGLRGS